MHDHSQCKSLGQHQLNVFAETSGLSQESLGKLIGVSQQTASKYLSGAARPSRYDIVRACDEKCGVTPGAFRQPVNAPVKRSRRRSAQPLVPNAA